MKEIDFLPRHFHHAARRRKTRRRLAVLAGLVFAYVLVHLTYETRVDRVLASSSEWFDEDVDPPLATAPAGNRDAAKTDGPTRLDPCLVQAERAVRRLLGDEYQLRWISFETTVQPGADQLNLHGCLRAVAQNELSVGIFMGRLASRPFCRAMELRWLREVLEAGRPMREFELTFTLDPRGFSK